jgi:hypothetical protein
MPIRFGLLCLTRLSPIRAASLVKPVPAGLSADAGPAPQARGCTQAPHPGGLRSSHRQGSGNRRGRAGAAAERCLQRMGTGKRSGPPDWNRTSIPRLGGMCTIHCATGRTRSMAGHGQNAIIADRFAPMEAQAANRYNVRFPICAPGRRTGQRPHAVPLPAHHTFKHGSHLPHLRTARVWPRRAA